VARELATPMMKLFQDEVSKLREKDAALERRIEELEGDVATLNGMLVP
jgi:ubiquinone biosynthesis protein UbiJ